MSTQRHSDQQFPPNSMIHVSLRNLNPPILENIHHLPTKLFGGRRSITHVSGQTN
jgi:hypothetical protein